VTEQLRRSATGHRQRTEKRSAAGVATAEAERKTLALPAILSRAVPAGCCPSPPGQSAPLCGNAVVRRAINVIKDRIAAMDWQIRVRRGVRPRTWPCPAQTEGAALHPGRAQRRGQLSHPHRADHRDALTGGFGASRWSQPAIPIDRHAVAGRWSFDSHQCRLGRAAAVAALCQGLPGQLESSAWICATIS